MKDTLLITGLIDNKTVKNKYKYENIKSNYVSLNEIFKIYNINKNKIYWRQNLKGPSSNKKVLFFEYPGETLWPKKKESTLTEVLLKTILKSNKYTYDFLDINEIVNESDSAKIILSKNFKSISLSTTHIHDIDTLLKILNIIKKYNKATIILGGRYASDNFKNLKKYFNSLIDYIIKYDGEIGYVHLLKCLGKGEKKECLKLVPNLIWISDNKLAENSFKTFDINKNMLPDWNLAEYGGDYIFYEAARGCNFRCRFCTYWLTEKKLNFKSTEKIFNEWSTYYKMGIKNIKIYDSTFAYPPERLIKLCRMLIKHNIKLKWSCYSRSTDIISESMAELMAKAGCELVSIGIESGSDIILKNMSKLATVRNHEDAIKYLEKAGIIAQCGFVIGFPGETLKTIEESYKFIINNNLRLVNIQPFTIRSLKMLILNPKFKKQFQIKLKKIDQDHYDWTHETMNLKKATKVSLDLKNKILNANNSSVSFRYYLNKKNLFDIDPYFFYDANALMQKFYIKKSKLIKTKLYKKVITELFNNYFIYEN